MASWMKGLVPTNYPGIWRTATGYRVRVRAVNPKTGLRTEANRTYVGIGIKEAQRKQVELRDELLGGYTTGERMRVRAFAQSWIRSKAGVVAEYTLQNYADVLDGHLLPIVGDHYYDCVGHLEVQEMVSRLLKKKKPNGKVYSVESIKDWFRVFRNMTRDAISHLNLDRDPTLRISFGDQVQYEAKETPTITDCLSLLEAMKQKRPGSFALLMTKLHTGQRFCHASALKWEDVDFESAVVRFRRKQVRGVVGPISKKKPAPQVVPLTAELLETLRAHRARMVKLGYPVGGDEWVFPTRNGKLKQPSSLTNAIKSSATEAAITVRITPHTMRYLFNDALRLAHVDKVTRKAMIGHVTDDMTEHYSTVLLDEKREAMEAAAVKLKGAGKGDRGDDRGYQSKKKKAA